MELLVIDTVVVSDFVNECDVNLILELVDIGSDSEQRLAVEDDPVRQLAESVLTALSNRDAVVEAKHIERAILRAVLGYKDEVLEALDHLVREEVEFIDDESLEVLG